jgi:hypothetical protein
MQQRQFDQTSTATAAQADCTPAYVTQLARAGLIDFIVASDGTRLFPRAAAPIVKRIKQQRLAGKAQNMLATRRANH